MFYGQHQEDAFIKQMFPNKPNGVCIEVGAYDGISLSNTKHFEEIGWRSLCIEPIPSAFDKCKTIRKECYQCCISDKDKEDNEFTIFHLNDNLCAISSFSAGPIRKACKNILLFMRKLRPVMMFSKTLMPLNKAKFWKVRAIPILATAWLSM